MGFLQAVHALGVMAQKRSQGSVLADIMSFLQLPHPLGEAEAKRARVIRVWLKVANADSEILDVLSVDQIEPPAEYPAFSDEDKIKEMYLYRKPVGAAAQWSFSPLYKLGKGETEGKQALLGNNWQTDKDSRYYKIKRTVLNDFEVAGCFSAGGVERIMQGLVERADELAAFWTDRKRSYLLLFGVENNGVFLHPGQVPAFINYFRHKLTAPKEEQVKNSASSREKILRQCACCGSSAADVETLDKVFKFATFDKDSFLPGAKDGAGIKEKVFPVCPDCYALLSAGKTEMESRFVNTRIIPGINLYVLPEVCVGDMGATEIAAAETRDFFENGIAKESRVFRNLARKGTGLVYHFLFTELNNAQVKVHCLIEDVPPTRLNHLQSLWGETCTAFPMKNPAVDQDDDDGRINLDRAFRQIVSVMLSLAGKREQDKTVMREKALAMIGALLNNEVVELTGIKELMVSRFAGLFTDPDWLRPKGGEELSGLAKVRGMAEVVDFLIRVNGRREV
ncbi:TM1802 family CRISPR-associated protein [Methylomusa anaerophila]|uniref:CRISPR-associated protein n=1 Tax=Methylomusa anaerophila TaxID=1930071 RepID=A0A348AR38_9FIRM|nr:TM1802 family CRISPR-associated protein [Methylomusa anaerophila]BBB93536.1 CRISPR-associated protein [Methylomusa anaerophila]